MTSPDYTGFIRYRFEKRVFIAYQGNDLTRPTITNNIEYLASKHGVDLILYLDSDNTWTGWSSKYGFFPLSVTTPRITDSILKAFLFKLKLKEEKKEK